MPQLFFTTYFTHEQRDININLCILHLRDSSEGQLKIYLDKFNRDRNTLLGGSSFARFCQQEFGEFPRPAWAVGSYSSGPTAGGTPQILVDKTLRMTSRLRVYCLECQNSTSCAILTLLQQIKILGMQFWIGVFSLIVPYLLCLCRNCIQQSPYWRARIWPRPSERASR